MLTDVTREFLKGTPLFRDASYELLDMIIAGSDHVHYNPGESVLDAGSVPGALPEGYCRIVRNHAVAAAGGETW